MPGEQGVGRPSPKTIGVPDVLFCLPFITALRGVAGLNVVTDPPAALAHRLDARTLDAAFLSPIDYARNASEYLIVPGSAVSSPEGNNSIVVHFRPGVRSVRTLAVPPTSASDIILAKMLLAERFDLNPTMVPVIGSLAAMLERADAALLAGDAALRSASSHPNGLDLVEEWVIATDLPYVHGFWVCREGALTEEEYRMIAAAPPRGHLSLGESEAAGALEEFSYTLSEEVREGIREFLRYAYYHGILPDVPDLRFYGSDEAAGPDPALN